MKVENYEFHAGDWIRFMNSGYLKLAVVEYVVKEGMGETLFTIYGPIPAANVIESRFGGEVFER